MPASSEGRRYNTLQTHYIEKVVTSADTGTTVNIGITPPGAHVINAGIVVTTAFAGGTPTIGIGTTADADGLASAVSVTSVGMKAADDLATSDDLYSTGDTTYTATLSASMTAGRALVFVEYIPADPAEAPA